MKQKRLEPSDHDALDEDEELTKRPRTRFVSLQPGGQDPADAIDDEIPGSVRADVEPLVLEGEPFNPYREDGTALTRAHLARDPAWARAQRKLLREREQDKHTMETVVQGEESDPDESEQYNEAGDAVEPFNLNKEMEEGYIDPEGTYIEYDRSEDRDAWLDSIEDQVEGAGDDTADALPYPNEPVAEDPPPVPPAELARYQRALVDALQPGEAVEGALRRLAGAGQVLDKYGDKDQAAKAWRGRMHSGRTIAPGNQHLFDQVTEAAEVLFDHGDTAIYSATREDIQAMLAQQAQQERAPPEAAPSPAATAAATAAAEGAATMCQTRQQAQQGQQESRGTGEGARAEHMDRRALRGERQPAAAAAALPAEGVASVPGAEREPRGAGQQRAVHGFAAAVEGDLLGEMPVSALHPQEVEAGLGLPTTSPTAVELQHKAHMEGAAAVKAAPMEGAAAVNASGAAGGNRDAVPLELEVKPAVQPGMLSKEGKVAHRRDTAEH